MLDWIALAMLVAIIALVIYGLVAVWGIPYDIAKARDHPHQDAIGAATLVSILTLGRNVAIFMDLGSGIPSRPRLGACNGSA